jgi:hypothetical protein
MDSLKNRQGAPCLTLLRHAGKPPLKRPYNGWPSRRASNFWPPHTGRLCLPHPSQLTLVFSVQQSSRDSRHDLEHIQAREKRREKGARPASRDRVAASASHPRFFACQLGGAIRRQKSSFYHGSVTCIRDIDAERTLARRVGARRGARGVGARGMEARRETHVKRRRRRRGGCGPKCAVFGKTFSDWKGRGVW